MDKKESFNSSVSIDKFQELLHVLLEQHHKLNNEVDILNTRTSLSSDESIHLRHIKLRKLKLKDKIETLRTELQLAE